MNNDERSTVLQHRFDATEPPTGEFTLTVRSGPDAGAFIVLDATRPAALVGTSQTCTLRLTDPSVSRRHLAVEMSGTSLRVRDASSTNGTFLGDVRAHEITVVSAAHLSVGSTTLEATWRSSDDASHPSISFADHFGRVLGASREMRLLYGACEKLAQATVPVIIEGETGTGKEALAEAIHERGPRADKPFVVFDCTATPSNLIESELFGYERGAFTGAAAQHRGVFEQADGGTLLIDEIGDMPLPEQAKLLRILERREFRRLGGERAISVDVRLIAATRRDLDKEIEAGRFRDDLFHRLAVARIELPPLRRRHGDIPLLCTHMWRELGGIGTLPTDVIARWEQHTWPGNVRELRNSVARYITFGEAAPLGKPAQEERPLDFESFVERVLAKDVPLAVARQYVVDEFERRYLERVLERNDGLVTKAAQEAGVARRHFHRLLLRTGAARR